MASNQGEQSLPAQGSHQIVLEGEGHSESNTGARVPTPPHPHQEEGTHGSAAHSNVGQMDILRTLADLLKNPASQPPPAPQVQRSVVERFLKLSPQVFYGRKDEDASVAEFWLEDVSQLFERLGGSSAEKV